MTIFVSREKWGARPRGIGTTQINPTAGVTVHYEGEGWSWPWDHSTCDNKVRAMQDYHMDVRGWSDIAYNYLGCPHNYLFEGRGYDRRSSANGDTYPNSVSFAIQAMWGDKAGARVPDNLKRSVRYGIDLLRSKGGASNKLLGHRDWKPTSCPGDELYAWVQQGCPLPYTAPPPPPVTGDDMPLNDTDLVKIKNIVVDAVRDYALWEVLYGLETEDEKAEAREAYSIARAAGKSVDEAKAAAAEVLSSLRDAIKKSQTL